MKEKSKWILEETAKLFLTYGVRSVSMDDICRKLGMSKKTLYEFVTDKEELIQKSLTDFIEGQVSVCNAFCYSNQNAIEQLIEINHYLIRLKESRNPACEYDLEKYYPQLHVKLHKTMTDMSFNMVLQNLQKGKEEGLFRDWLDEEIIATLYVSRMEFIMHTSSYNNNEGIKSLFNQIFEYHIRGIATDKGIELFEKTYKTN